MINTTIKRNLSKKRFIWLRFQSIIGKPGWEQEQKLMDRGGTLLSGLLSTLAQLAAPPTVGCAPPLSIINQENAQRLAHRPIRRRHFLN